MHSHHLLLPPLYFFICDILYFRETAEWVWLQGSEQVGGGDSPGTCTQMALGTLGRWGTAQCAGRHRYICEMDVTGKISVSLKNTWSIDMQAVWCVQASWETKAQAE